MFSSYSKQIMPTWLIVQYVGSICFKSVSFPCSVYFNIVSFLCSVSFKAVWFPYSVWLNTELFAFTVLISINFIANFFISLIAVINCSNYFFVSRLEDLDSMSRHCCSIIESNGRLVAIKAGEENISQLNNMMFERGSGFKTGKYIDLISWRAWRLVPRIITKTPDPDNVRPTITKTDRSRQWMRHLTHGPCQELLGGL